MDLLASCIWTFTCSNSSLASLASSTEVSKFDLISIDLVLASLVASVEFSAILPTSRAVEDNWFAIEEFSLDMCLASSVITLTFSMKLFISMLAFAISSLPFISNCLVKSPSPFEKSAALFVRLFKGLSTADLITKYNITKRIKNATRDIII